MKLIVTAAVALGLALSSGSAFGQTSAATQAAAPAVKASAKAYKAILDLQDTVTKKDWANVAAKVAAAQAVASTKEDRYLIASQQLRAAAATNDVAAFSSALETIAQTGLMSSSMVASLYGNLAGTYIDKKQYPLAITAYEKALAIDPNNIELMKLLGEVQSGSGDKAGAVATFQKAMQAGSAAGQRPDEDLMRRAVAAAYDAKLPAAVTLAQQWVAAYPSADSWGNALAIYGNLNQTDPEGKLVLFRLMQATGSLTSADKFAQYAIAATDLNNSTEAQAAIDAGIAANQLNASDPQYREIVAAVKAKPKPTAADLEEATREAANGNALLRIGDRYYALGNYAKAVELYRKAISKGVDQAVANLHIGMALARVGDNVGAKAALNAVTGPRAQLAKYWLIYLNQKA